MPYACFSPPLSLPFIYYKLHPKVEAFSLVYLGFCAFLKKTLEGVTVGEKIEHIA